MKDIVLSIYSLQISVLDYLDYDVVSRIGILTDSASFLPFGISGFVRCFKKAGWQWEQQLVKQELLSNQQMHDPSSISSSTNDGLPAMNNELRLSRLYVRNDDISHVSTNTRRPYDVPATSMACWWA